MSRDADSVRLARKILGYHQYKPKARTTCGKCHGTGKYEDEDHHHGAPYTATCHCVYAGREDVRVHVADDALLRLAKFYLTKKGKRNVSRR